ncbi:MAG: hypothetical protein QOE65_3089 [Solirubrobacteraceae bacterium]|jgi:hypothetical protein|nr:hypothetical protein [Solirubrobacteraceae bacterium]
MRILRYLLLAAAASLALPAASGASIVVQKGMLGGNLNMTVKQLRARIGPPSAVRTQTNEIFGAYDEYRWGEVYVSAFRSNGAIFNYFTRGRSARTTSGVGVGSTEAYLKAKVSGEKCTTNSGARTCVVGKELAGEIVTAFLINTATGRVRSVTVGRVID